MCQILITRQIWFCEGCQHVYLTFWGNCDPYRPPVVLFRKTRYTRRQSIPLIRGPRLRCREIRSLLNRTFSSEQVPRMPRTVMSHVTVRVSLHVLSWYSQSKLTKTSQTLRNSLSLLLRASLPHELQITCMLTQKPNAETIELLYHT